VGKKRGKKRGKGYVSRLPPKFAAIVLLNEKDKKVKEGWKEGGDGGREWVILAEISHRGSGHLCLLRSENTRGEIKERDGCGF